MKIPGKTSMVEGVHSVDRQNGKYATVSYLGRLRNTQ